MSTLNIERTQLGWRFWSIWMAASIVSVIVFSLLAPLVYDLLLPLAPGLRDGADVPEQRWLVFAINLLSISALGALIGLAQWLILRRYLPDLGWWILATAIGYALPLELGTVMPLREPPWLAGTVMFVTFGLALGIFQWLVLRRHVPHSEWWIAFTLAGWILAFALTGIAFLTNLYVEPFDMLSAFLVPIGTAGIGMIWLLRRSPKLSNVPS